MNNENEVVIFPAMLKKIMEEDSAKILELVTRKCVGCDNTFRVLPKDEQKYCSQDCMVLDQKLSVKALRVINFKNKQKRQPCTQQSV